MSQINPFLPIMAQSPQAQREAAIARDAIVRRAKEKQRNSGSTIEYPDEFIESASKVDSIGDEDQPRKQQRERKKHKRANPREDDEPPGEGISRIDMKA